MHYSYFWPLWKQGTVFTHYSCCWAPLKARCFTHCCCKGGSGVLILWWLVLNEETEQVTMRTCLEHRQEKAWGHSYAQTHTTRHTYIYTRAHALVPCTNIINIPFSLGCGRFGTEFSSTHNRVIVPVVCGIAKGAHGQLCRWQQAVQSDLQRH